MKTSDFHFELPAELIARHPAPARGDSRLLHLGRGGRIRHRRFSDLPALLSSGDLLVRNISRVIPARIPAEKAGRGGRVELLVLPLPSDRGMVFEALTRPALRRGTRLLAGGAVLEVEDSIGDGRRRIRIVEGAAHVLALAERAGRTPLPPYLRRGSAESSAETERDRERYQTVYASEPGSIAAPTAGLHFEEAMFSRLAARGVDVRDLILHVGYGTFAPVRTGDPRHHQLAAERFEVPEPTRRAVLAQLDAGRRVVAVGTTTVRVLETPGVVGTKEAAGDTSLLILPGHRFQVVSAMLTNFHLPQSSLLMLVSALGGREQVLAAYREAVRERYRFYSYGDAMLVEKRGRAVTVPP